MMMMMMMMMMMAIQLVKSCTTKKVDVSLFGGKKCRRCGASDNRKG
jgi:hypothetical protein